jgi:calcineurin-like phosphoesterase family protein
MSDLYFTSDEHYGHGNIIRFCNRPFKSTDDHIRYSVEEHNKIVPKGARVYHDGDMFWRTLPVQKAHDIMDQLNGQHYFIWGNHDELIEDNPSLKKRFVWCKDIAQVYHPKLNKPLVLCHYAMHVWRNSHKGAYHLYGHTHANLPEQNNLSFDCGQDAQGFKPISIEDVIQRMEKKRLAGAEDPMMPSMRAQKWGHDAEKKE